MRSAVKLIRSFDGGASRGRAASAPSQRPAASVPGSSKRFVTVRRITRDSPFYMDVRALVPPVSFPVPCPRATHPMFLDLYCQSSACCILAGCTTGLRRGTCSLAGSRQDETVDSQSKIHTTRLFPLDSHSGFAFSQRIYAKESFYMGIGGGP